MVYTSLQGINRCRSAALGLYEAAGFQVIQDVLVYRKDYPGKERHDRSDLPAD
jgi:hypothetical protein